jgi:hypothetical protein
VQTAKKRGSDGKYFKARIDKIIGKAFCYVYRKA